MAEIKIEEKKRPIWPWLLVLLIIIVVVWLVVTRGNEQADPSYGAPPETEQPEVPEEY